MNGRRLMLAVLSTTTFLLLTTTITITTSTIIEEEEDGGGISTTTILIPINDEISLKQKLVKLLNSSKSDKPWLLDYKISSSYTLSKSNIYTKHILLLAEPKSLARPRNLEFIIINDDKKFNFNYYERIQGDVIPSHAININKCTPDEYLNELKNIDISLDTKPDVQYGNVINKTDNSPKNWGERTKKYPQLKPRLQFKLLTTTPKKKNIYYIHFYVTTWKQHFDDIFLWNPVAKF